MAVLSDDAVTTFVPAGLNRAENTSPLCPFNVLISFPLLLSHIFTVESDKAVIKILPNDESRMLAGLYAE